MNERDFFDERQETKQATYSCPHCRERAEYQVRWLRRTKKAQPPRGINEQQRAQFHNARDYMVRMDDTLDCARCRKRFDIPNSQSVVFIETPQAHSERRPARPKRRTPWPEEPITKKLPAPSERPAAVVPDDLSSTNEETDERWTNLSDRSRSTVASPRSKRVRR